MNIIPPIDNTNNIRYAEFVRLTTPLETFLFCTAPSAITVSAISENPFEGLGQVISIGDVQRDIKSTANETSVTLVGLDTAFLSLVLTQQLKGSQIELWKGFFDTNGNLLTDGGVGGLYQYFNGYITTYSIAEQWMEIARAYVGVVTIGASSIQLILQNRTAGRYTNNSSWQFFNSGDTSMSRVAFISNINYYFGKDASPNS